MASTEYAVTGMTCSHCERAVAAEVEQIAGVTAVTVDAASGRLTVTSDRTVEAREVVAAVEEAGYQPAPRLDAEAPVNSGGTGE